MRKNNFNMKGATDVKTNAESWNSDWVDSKNAAVIRDESEWNAFQLMGDTNAEEVNYVTDPEHLKDNKEVEAVLERGLAFRVGRKVKMLLESQGS